MTKIMMKKLTILTLITLAISSFLPGGLCTTSNEEVENLVVLLTDYGTSDFYVGALEGVIYSTNPNARISTITHEVADFDIAEGSYLLAQAAQKYPSGAVFVTEVDPGAGMEERSIVLKTTDGKLFVGPDNGLFTGIMDELKIASVHEITNVNLIEQGKASTNFRGISIYGPVAGHLSAGMDLSEVGPTISDPVRMEVVTADLVDGNLIGIISHVDSWGNMITNIPQELIERSDLLPGDRVEISVGGENLEMSFGTTYGDVPQGEWVAMVSYLGRLVIARNMDNAAETLGVSAGAEVRIHEIG